MRIERVVQRMVQAGLITPDQSHQHPQKNQLVAALGMEGEVEPHTVVRAVELREGDAFLLCSDGLNKTVSDEEIASLLAHSDHNCQEAVKAFIHLALMRDASDNVTTVVVNIGDPTTDCLATEDVGSETMANPIPPDWYLE